MKHDGTQYTPRGYRWTRGDARGIDWGRAVQRSQAKDSTDRVKILTKDTAIGRQRMPRNQRENAQEVISSTPSSSIHPAEHSPRIEDIFAKNPKSICRLWAKCGLNVG